MMRYVKMAVALLAIGLAWVVTFVWNVFGTARHYPPRHRKVIYLTGRWPYRWLT